MDACYHSGSSCDGLLHTKSLQDACLEYVASQILETVSRDPLHQVQAEEHEQLTMYTNNTHLSHLLANIRAVIDLEKVLGRDGRLPAHFCDRILAHLASRCKLTDLVVRCVSDESIGCVTKVPMPPFFTPDTLRTCVGWPLVELSVCIHDLNGFDDLVESLMSSKASSTLRSLTISTRGLITLRIEQLDFLKSLLRLQLEGCNPGNVALVELVEKLPSLTTLIVTRSIVLKFPCKGTTTLRQLTLPHAFVDRIGVLLRDIVTFKNLVYLDVTREDWDCEITPPLEDKTWLLELSQMPNLKYLDVSRWPVTVNDVANFDPPHHRMNFLGLLSTQACLHRDINSDAVSEACLCVQCWDTCSCMWANKRYRDNLS